MDRSREKFEVLVVGGGPAGMAAAARAAECGKRVAIVDDNAAPGGQIFRGQNLGEVESLAEVRRHLTGVRFVSGKKVFDMATPGILLAEGAEGVWELWYAKLIVATGARERFLPFPGWTLPNVLGAGGLQAMVKSGLPVRGKTVVVAGSGPLLLAVAAYLRAQGAEISLIAEQASWSALARFAARLWSFRGKIGEALELRRKLAGIRFAANSWPVMAHGAEKLEAVSISTNGRVGKIECDFLACGFHLVPNVELAVLLGCAMENGFVKVNRIQETTVPGVYCAGEPVGIGGLESALAEGAIAGLAASGYAIDETSSLFRAREKARYFARLLEKTFSLRAELNQLPNDETIVCRCEDVRYSRLRLRSTWRAAKLQTRCGMGPCQGRVCGPAAEFLLGWKVDSVRPPVFPARVESLAAGSEEFAAILTE